MAQLTFRSFLFMVLPFSAFGQNMLPELNMWRPNNRVYCIDVDSANNVAYIGGLFTSLTDPDPPFTTVERNRVAAIDLTTGEPLPWNPNSNAGVLSIAHTTAAVYIAGDFQNIGGQSRTFLAAVNKTSGTALPWDPALGGGPVRVLTIAAGKLFVGGTFTQVAGTYRPHAAAFDLSTGNLTGWNPEPTDIVLAFQAMGATMYMGGYFTTLAGGLPSPFLAGVDMDYGTTLSYVAAPNAVPVAPTTSLQLLTSGSMDAGTSNSLHNSSSHLCSWILNSSVRLAFEMSVTWTWPPVSFQTSQESTVPKASSPAWARCRAPGTLFNIQRTLVAEK